MIRQHHRITSAVALALALAASVAPAASADPAPLAKAEAAIAANGRATTAVRPNPDEQTLTLTTVSPGLCSEVCLGGGYQANGLGAAAHTAPVGHVTAPSSGFDWRDAGVGAGGMLAVILIGIGGAITVGRRRSHSATPTTRPDPQGQH